MWYYGNENRIREGIHNIKRQRAEPKTGPTLSIFYLTSNLDSEILLHWYGQFLTEE